jgi:RNA polymerase sigma-B factor
VTATALRSAHQRDLDDSLLRRYAASKDPALLDALVRRWMPLARQLAGRYRRSSEPLDDLEQVAAMGLVKALQRYDPDRGGAFSSYAVPTITGELKRHFRDRTWSVRVPRSTKELVLKIDDARDQLFRTFGRSPSVAELAQACDATDEEILEALQAGASYRATSLDAQVDDDADSADRGSLLGTYDDGFRQAEHRTLIDDVSSVLDDRDREIIRLRFEEDLTQQEIAERIGVSQMQISRLLRRALDQLRLQAERSPARAAVTAPED